MSALNSFVVSAATKDGARLFQWRLVLGKKEYLGYHYKSGVES